MPARVTMPVSLFIWTKPTASAYIVYGNMVASVQKDERRKSITETGFVTVAVPSGG
jgi:hypothetical protein